MVATTKQLPKCCVAHIGVYIDVDPDEYPRDRAALCCATCKARLVYTKASDTWTRTAQEDMPYNEPPPVDPEVVKKRATLKPQRVTKSALQGGLFANLED
jgi:hypothetical protein